jgi:hypothetical protein
MPPATAGSKSTLNKETRTQHEAYSKQISAPSGKVTIMMGRYGPDGNLPESVDVHIRLQILSYSSYLKEKCPNSSTFITFI